MAVFRKIQTNFWQDDFVLGLTPEEKYFYIYLMTNSKTNQSGCYELPKKIIEFETGYNSETVEKLLNRFLEYKKIEYDSETKELFLVNWSKYNWSTSPKVLSCIKKEVESVKNKGFRKKLDTVLIQYGYSMDTPTQEEEEEEEEKEEEKNKKNKYAQFVKMSESEYATLTEKYGIDKTKRMIDILDNYKGASGKPYKSDYRAILNWVIKRIEEDDQKTVKKDSTLKNIKEVTFHKGVEDLVDKMYRGDESAQ